MAFEAEVGFALGRADMMSTSEFVMQKEKVVSAVDEVLPAGWMQRLDLHEQGRQSTPSGSGGAKILQAESTGTLRGRLVGMLDSASETFCVCSFLLADGPTIRALLRASERGVRVYVLTASEVQLQKEPRIDNEFDVARLEEHIRTLQELAGRVLVRTGESFHSKFVLVDPSLKEARGFLLTANLTEEALTRNVELGVQLDAKETRDLYRQFLIGFWQESSNELLDRGLAKVEPLTGVTIPLPTELLSTTRISHTIRAAAEDLVGKAKTEIVVSSFGMDLQEGVVGGMVQAAKSGKKVRVLARPRPNKNTMNALMALAEAGAEIRGHQWLHAKFLLVDTDEGWSGLIMTANFESKGLDEGFESGISVRGQVAEDLHLIMEGWWHDFAQILFIKKRLGNILGDVLLWSDETLKKVSVQAEANEDLGEFEAKSFDEMDKLVPPIVQRGPTRGTVLYHRKTFRWRVLAPRLPGGVSRVPRDGDLKVYRRGKELFVAIGRLEELPKARALGEELSAKVVAEYTR